MRHLLNSLWFIPRRKQRIKDKVLIGPVTCAYYLAIYTQYFKGMDPFRMRFIIGKLTNEELHTLRRGEPIISKMLLIPEDYRVFHYREGDEIEVETPEGNRIWTTIRHLEIVEDPERIIVILTLIHNRCDKTK